MRNVQRDLERLAQQTYKMPVVHLPGMKYVYVLGQTPKGKTVVLGPYRPGEPQVEATEAELTDSECFELDTRDLSKATREIKHIMLGRGRSVDESLSRVGHQL